MSLMDDCIEWMDFCDDLVRELRMTKGGEFKMGTAEGLELATDMLRAYLVDYPDFVDPKIKLERFKMT